LIRKNSGVLIVLTGIDGSGKSTAARALVEAARTQGTEALLLSNHAGRRRISLLCAKLGVDLPGSLADAIETAIRVVNVLANHARASRFDGLVVMDRHLHCQLALRQTRGIARGWLLPRLLAILPTPDFHVHLEADPARAHARIVERGVDEESLADLLSFGAAYRSLPEFDQFVEIDADASPEEVLARLQQIVAGIRAVGV
jgi:dTMP kinase